jgi:Dyp-type peroxidase family
VNERLEVSDIQGLVVRGYGNLTSACYVLVDIVDPTAARGWLGAMADEVNTARMRPSSLAVNVAFTHAGLEKLGLPPTALGMFSLEFVDGIVDPHRSRILGDTGESAPETWVWGGPRTTAVDAVLLLFATDEDSLEQAYTDHRRRFEQAGLHELARLDTTNLGVREHFGFRDGISQPTIAGSGYSDTPMNTIQSGEFVLGYTNEHGQIPPTPTVPPAADPGRVLPRSGDQPDFGRNGSYLVFRQLYQNVRGFWRFADTATRNADGTSNEARRTWLAAKMVGRWPSGAPLSKTPEHDDPSLATDNDFAYAATDLYGFNCPVGAHIRRGNPRDSLEPGPGTQQSINVSKHHRLIRRGREYGPPVDPTTLFATDASADHEVDRGLYFISLCGDLARQFEFVQHTWMMSTKFADLYDDADPLLGAPDASRGTFTVQSQPLRHRFDGLSRFVSVRGGAYFFLPGVRAIRFLARAGA